MFSTFMRLLVLTLLFGMAVPQSGGAQTNDLATLRGEVDRLYRKGKYSEATAAARRYVDQAKQKHGLDHLEFAKAISWLAYSLHAEGRYAAAELLYKRSLAILEKVLGPEHPDVAETLNNLAAVYQGQGRHAAAEELHKRSFTIWEKALGPEHPLVATSLNNLAALYESQGRYAEAEPLHKRSLAIREKALGPRRTTVICPPQRSQVSSLMRIGLSCQLVIRQVGNQRTPKRYRVSRRRSFTRARDRYLSRIGTSIVRRPWR